MQTADRKNGRYCRVLLAGFALFVAGLSTGRLRAQSTTTPLGMYKLGAYASNGTYIGLQANSDTLVSLPFTRAPEFVGSVSAVSGSTLTVTGAPGWTANQFVYAVGTQPKTYFVLIGAGPNGTTNPKEGCIYAVTANSTNSLTLALNGDVISSIPANSLVSVIPYWTLNTVFPAANAGVSFTATASTKSFQTQVYIPSYSGTGINLAYSSIYYFIKSGTNNGWRLGGDLPTKDHGDDILLPDGYIVVRNQNGAPTLPLALMGTVVTGKVTTPETASASAPQDNSIAMVRPIDVSLNNTGLSPANGNFVATTTTKALKDELFLYNNLQIAFNKAPSAIYYYMNNSWRLGGDLPTADHGSDIVPAGSAIIIRKAANGTGQTSFWTNTATY
jgi:uncharacterized protein (TIGR02597 family)